MDYLSIIFIALSLATDCFAVSLGAAATQYKFTKFKVIRVSLAFGLAQFLMPILGWMVGKTIVDLISGFDHWVAFALLLIVGGRMLWETFRNDDESKKNLDISKGLLLLTLAIATSIDALAVGLSFAFLNIDIITASIIIGIVALLVTTLGFWIGGKISILLGKWAKLAGGIILIAIGLRILLSHLLQ